MIQPPGNHGHGVVAVQVMVVEHPTAVVHTSQCEGQVERTTVCNTNVEVFVSNSILFCNSYAEQGLQGMFCEKRKSVRVLLTCSAALVPESCQIHIKRDIGHRNLGHIMLAEEVCELITQMCILGREGKVTANRQVERGEQEQAANVIMNDKTTFLTNLISADITLYLFLVLFHTYYKGSI